MNLYKLRRHPQFCHQRNALHYVLKEWFLRVEDFCISAEEQGKGFGTEFIKLVFEKSKELGCDSVLLGTLRDFPSHKFYLKIGFSEVDSVLLYKEL